MWDESGWIEIDGGGGRTDAVAVANLKCGECATCPGYSTWPGHGSCLHILARSVTDFRSVFMKRGCRRRRLSCFGRMEHMLLVLIQTPAGGVAVTHSSLSGRGSQKILLSLESADKRDFERRIYGSF